jgi:putative DNA primase/helicase
MGFTRDLFMHKDRQEVRNDLADLAGSRFVCALESQEGKRLSEPLVKQLTGGVDLIKARFLFQEHFTFKPQFKIFLGTNHKPVIKDTDSAIWESRALWWKQRLATGVKWTVLDASLKNAVWLPQRCA